MYSSSFTWRILPLVLSMMVISTIQADNTAVMEEKMDVGKTRLILNGSGMRTAFGMLMYTGGLYLLQKNDNDKEIMNADVPMAVKMVINSSLITSERLGKSMMEGFVNSTGGKMGPVETQINTFIAKLKKDLKKGDVFTFIYVPGQGTEVIKNGVTQLTIESLSFKKALFGIWMCDKPPQRELKTAMLGKR